MNGGKPKKAGKEKKEKKKSRVREAEYCGIVCVCVCVCVCVFKLINHSGPKVCVSVMERLTILSFLKIVFAI